LIIALVVVLGLIAAGLLYQAAGTRRDQRKFPPLGKMVETGGPRLHLHVSGAGNPTVILEAGIAATSVSWQLVQPPVAAFTRVMSYDRAGLGWSDLGPQRTLREIVDELRRALAAGAWLGPYVLVGHSFGGLVVRAYAAWHPEEVAGLVLVDPVMPAEWIDMAEKQRRTLGYGVTLSRRGAWLARLGVVRLSLALLMSGTHWIPKLVARISSGRGSGVAERLVGEVQKLPPEIWEVVRAHWCQPKSFRGMAAYLAALPACAEEVSRLVEPCGIPLAILSAASATPEQLREWDRLAALGKPGWHVRVPDAGHWVQLDQPDYVTNAIREVVDLARAAAISSPL
jgi:pimeloyl-ACP methyl ester carboxylesterase